MVTATKHMTYEETIQDIKNNRGRVPGFMTCMSREKLIRDWPSWKGLGELDFERASSLMCIETESENEF